jgi:transposase
MSSEEAMAKTVWILRSIPGIGPAAITIQITEVPQLRAVSGEQAACLTGEGEVVAGFRARC